MPRKIIIDTDPGIDDAMAIFFALKSPEFEVLGLTSIFGNASTATCTTNALRLLEIAGRSDIPVAAGAPHPLDRPFKGAADFVHGADGQGNVSLPDPQTQPIGQRAHEFIIDTVLAQPGEVTLVPLGPLTNIALALQLEPNLATAIAEIVLMGGNAFCPGNASPTAEANIINDPAAADIVFGADCPIVMCGLDVTEKINMSSAFLAQFADIDTPEAQHIARILPHYQAFYHGRYGHDFIHVHDSTTINYLLRPDLFETVQHPIRVDFSDGIGRGKTWPGRGDSDIEDAWSGRRPVTICTNADSEALIALELERIGG